MFVYGMKSRGFSIGAQPEGVVEWSDVNKEMIGFYSIIKYNRKLTDEEISRYDLVDLQFVIDAFK